MGGVSYVKNCPYCKADLQEGINYLVCPYCGEELPKNSNENIDISSLKVDNTIKTNNSIKKGKPIRRRKSFMDAYIEYLADRAYVDSFICPIFGAIIAVASVILVFVTIYFLFGLILSAIFFLLGFINWKYYEHNKKK